MRFKRTIQTLGVFLLTALSALANAETYFSVSSLKIICGSETPNFEAVCKAYLHGVVETWMYKDVVGVNPPRYQSRGSHPTFCDTIDKVSDDEWLKIVRINLNSLPPGLATDAVMKTLSNQLCK